MASGSIVCTTSAFTSCAIGVALNKECHSHRPTNKQIGLLKTSELSAECKFLLTIQTGLELQILDKEQVCIMKRNTYQDIQVSKVPVLIPERYTNQL